MADKPFFVKSPKQMPALEAWLAKREFNCGGFTKRDRKGNPMVGLGFDARPDKEHGLPEKRGLIVVRDHALFGEVEEMVKRMAARPWEQA